MKISLSTDAKAKIHRTSDRHPTRTRCGRPIWGAQKVMDACGEDCGVCVRSVETHESSTDRKKDP